MSPSVSALQTSYAPEIFPEMDLAADLNEIARDTVEETGELIEFPQAELMWVPESFRKNLSHFLGYAESLFDPNKEVDTAKQSWFLAEVNGFVAQQIEKGGCSEMLLETISHMSATLDWYPTTYSQESCYHAIRLAKIHSGSSMNHVPELWKMFPLHNDMKDLSLSDKILHFAMDQLNGVEVVWHESFLNLGEKRADWSVKNQYTQSNILLGIQQSLLSYLTMQDSLRSEETASFQDTLQRFANIVAWLPNKVMQKNLIAPFSDFGISINSEEKPSATAESVLMEKRELSLISYNLVEAFDNQDMSTFRHMKAQLANAIATSDVVPEMQKDQIWKLCETLHTHLTSVQDRPMIRNTHTRFDQATRLLNIVEAITRQEHFRTLWVSSYGKSLGDFMTMSDKDIIEEASILTEQGTLRNLSADLLEAIDNRDISLFTQAQESIFAFMDGASIVKIGQVEKFIALSSSIHTNLQHGVDTTSNLIPRVVGTATANIFTRFTPYNRLKALLDSIIHQKHFTNLWEAPIQEAVVTDTFEPEIEITNNNIIEFPTTPTDVEVIPQEDETNNEISPKIAKNPVSFSPEAAIKSLSMKREEAASEAPTPSILSRIASFFWGKKAA